MPTPKLKLSPMLLAVAAGLLLFGLWLPAVIALGLSGLLWAVEPPRMRRGTLADGTRVEEHYRRRKLHRGHGPARVINKPDGTRIEEWRWNSRLHREGAPALTATKPDGTREEQWWQFGLLHREDGPARARIARDGTTITEEFWHRGKRNPSSRQTGPVHQFTRRGPDECTPRTFRRRRTRPGNPGEGSS